MAASISPAEPLKFIRLSLVFELSKGASTVRV